jgi:hypothetical protein
MRYSVQPHVMGDMPKNAVFYKIEVKIK